MRTLEEIKVDLVKSHIEMRDGIPGAEDRAKQLSQEKSTAIRRLKTLCVDCGTAIRRGADRCFLHSIRHRFYSRSIASVIALLFLPMTAKSATLTCSWTNGDNPTAVSPPWVTIVSYGIAPGVYTNSVTVPYSQTNVVISNLVSGVRYYASAQHSDGTDTSVASNESNAKTKINPPKNATASTP